MTTRIQKGIAQIIRDRTIKHKDGDVVCKSGMVEDICEFLTLEMPLQFSSEYFRSIANGEDKE